MNEIIKVQNIIRSLRNTLAHVLYSKNIEFSIVRLLFLKYVVDNYIGANSVENMQFCAKAQKMFAMRDVENGGETIIPVLNYIDNAYGLTSILSSNENIEEYSNELFGTENQRQRKNVVSNNFKEIMDVLGSIDLEEKNKDNSLGKTLVDALIENIAINSNKNAFSSEYTTKKNLSKLAAKILNVQPNEIFCDFVSGVGFSTIEITKKKLPNIINAEKNNTAIAISAMLYIMYGYKNFQIFSGDSLTKYNDKIIGDKIFVDGPIAAKVEKTEDNEYGDSSLAIINRVLHNYMSKKESAMAVITLPSSPLFTTRKNAVGLREEMVSNGMVQAVIALPPMWGGTMVGTNLLVISRKPQEKVVFINAADDKLTSKHKNDSTGAELLSDEKINLIIDVISNQKSILGFSCVINKNKITNKEYKLVPASYVKVNKEEDDISLKTIDEQLSKLYRQLVD